jgi:geranylgeranyl diphosphate synthase type I
MTASTTRTTPDRTAALILAEARQLTGPAHRAAVYSVPGDIRHMIGYHIGWWDVDGNPVSTSGKAIRPALALACAAAAASDGLSSGMRAAAIDAAVAVELVHDFSLVHDDVIDSDPVRRHRPTLWRVFGTGQAILVGDVLLVLAMQQLPSAPSAHVLAGVILDLCVGQSADLAFEQSDSVTLPECVGMAEGKTGALLGAACQLGALAAGADEAVAGLYRTFGRELGLAFQLIDDLLGIWGDPTVTGKPAGSDLASRKKSLPVVAALSSGTLAGAELARLYGREGAMDATTIARAADLVQAGGGRDWARQEATRRASNALRALSSAHPAQAAADDLRTLAALITRRDF